MYRSLKYIPNTPRARITAWREGLREFDCRSGWPGLSLRSPGGATGALQSLLPGHPDQGFDQPVPGGMLTALREHGGRFPGAMLTALREHGGRFPGAMLTALREHGGLSRFGGLQVIGDCLAWPRKAVAMAPGWSCAAARATVAACGTASNKLIAPTHPPIRTNLTPRKIHEDRFDRDRFLHHGSRRLMNRKGLPGRPLRRHPYPSRYLTKKVSRLALFRALISVEFTRNCEESVPARGRSLAAPTCLADER
jgi:hypothetical protein